MGGRLCYFLERRVASYMYTAHSRYVSLYVMPQHGLPSPPDALMTLAQPRATVHAVQGYTQVIWLQTDLLYALVSDLPKEQLFEMVRQMVPTG